MSLINDALKRARLEEATKATTTTSQGDHDHAKVSFNAVVARESTRGGMKVKSLLMGTSLVLAGSIVAVLVVGLSNQPRSADAQNGVGDRTGAVELDHKEKEEIREKSKGVSDTDVVTLPMQGFPIDSPQEKGVSKQDAGTAVSPITAIPVVPVKPTVAPPVNPVPTQIDATKLALTIATNNASDTKMTSKPATPSVNAPTDQAQREAALIAAVVKAMRTLQKDDDASGSTPSQSPKVKPAKPSPNDDTASNPTPVSQFPTFVGEVLDERFPHMSINGITRSNNQQAAIINRKIVMLGDTVGDATVERIERKRVRMKYRGKTFFLALP